MELCKGMKPVAMTGHFLYTKLCNTKINPGDVLTYDITISDVELIWQKPLTSACVLQKLVQCHKLVRNRPWAEESALSFKMKILLIDIYISQSLFRITAWYESLNSKLSILHFYLTNIKGQQKKASWHGKEALLNSSQSGLLIVFPVILTSC